MLQTFVSSTSPKHYFLYSIFNTIFGLMYFNISVIIRYVLALYGIFGKRSVSRSEKGKESQSPEHGNEGVRKRVTIFLQTSERSRHSAQQRTFNKCQKISMNPIYTQYDIQCQKLLVDRLTFILTTKRNYNCRIKRIGS